MWDAIPIHLMLKLEFDEHEWFWTIETMIGDHLDEISGERRALRQLRESVKIKEDIIRFFMILIELKDG